MHGREDENKTALQQEEHVKTTIRFLGPAVPFQKVSFAVLLIHI